ncbi:shikimate kinase [Clostridium estertheticum]|uniref:Shikimate kinase n=1 Tax=Clostridium estertheticum TaxID=238834 RepID=A0A7Y3T0U2_9CLOT|nr:shikimate kinase [Clostridium estertheticum]MBW9171905.1 shikimate kinase [Clostridium estertheticum]NNU77284.1 shikimate kinase [Clostridium estertheticum]WBL45717.1 shikimate kinase [Clostridium estertheticum]WLC73798.1 shikimate kinase [Clostridium estertheticum]
MKNIVLIGMPGCGKSEIGEILADKIEMNFIDVDVFIESSTSRSITEIFKNGEDAFRDIESIAVRDLSKKNHVVISTGGGVIKRYENIMNLKRNGIIIYINRPIQNIVSDINIEGRPLLANDPGRISKLFDERGPLYKKYCDYEVMNISEINDVVNSIIQIYTKSQAK